MEFENRTEGGLPTRAKRYLLRLINTSFQSTFIFSIDNHWLQIVTADFVPIEPYYNTSIFIGIGQRYNVIVEAKPDGDINDTEGNFWIRTSTPPRFCGVAQDPVKQTNQTGILRYNNRSTALPNSLPWRGVSVKCSDETYTSLRPKIPWYIGKPANNILSRTFRHEE